MLEALGQALGAFGGLLLEAGGHRPGDRQELRLDAAADAAGSALELHLQSGDGPFEAHDGVALARLPPLAEVDDLTHAAIVDRGTDTAVEPGHTRLGRVG